MATLRNKSPILLFLSLFLVLLFGLFYFLGYKDVFNIKKTLTYKKTILQKDIPPNFIKYFAEHGELQNLDDPSSIEEFNRYLALQSIDWGKPVYLAAFRLMHIDGTEVYYEFRNWGDAKCLEINPTGIFRGSLEGIDIRKIVRLSFYEKEDCNSFWYGPDRAHEIPMRWNTSPYKLLKQYKDQHVSIIEIESINPAITNNKLLWRVKVYDGFEDVKFSDIIDDNTGKLYEEPLL
jgi:hypothetical protein